MTTLPAITDHFVDRALLRAPWLCCRCGRGYTIRRAALVWIIQACRVVPGRHAGHRYLVHPFGRPETRLTLVENHGRLVTLMRMDGGDSITH